MVRGGQGGHPVRRTIQAQRGGRWGDAGAAKAADPPHRERLHAGGAAAPEAETHGQAIGGGGVAGGRIPHAERAGRKGNQPGGAGESLHQRRAGLQQGEQIHRPVFQHSAEKRADHPDGGAAGRLRRTGAGSEGHRAARGTAVWGDRQRQNAGVSEAHRTLPCAGAESLGAGAGDQPDAADDPAAEIAVRQPGRCAALGTQSHRAAAPMADDPGRRRGDRGRHPQCHLCAAGGHRVDHH